MSAFLCSDYHISYIVQAGVRYKAWLDLGNGYGYLTEEKAQHVFEVLKRENLRSVNFRYRENNPVGNIGKLNRTIGGIEPIQTLKAINCLDYQSCETEDWPGTLAAKILNAIKEAAIRELPGYQAAQWGVDDVARANRKQA